MGCYTFELLDSGSTYYGLWQHTRTVSVDKSQSHQMHHYVDKKQQARERKQAEKREASNLCTVVFKCFD